MFFYDLLYLLFSQMLSYLLNLLLGQLGGA